MSKLKDPNSYQAKVLARKFNISIEDAEELKYGEFTLEDIEDMQPGNNAVAVKSASVDETDDNIDEKEIEQ